MSKVVDIVKDFLIPYAKKCELEIVDVEYKKMENGYNLIIYIDKQGGVNIQDCVKLHKLINDPLDELDPTKGQPYNLSVSSCGLNRPLKTENDFLRAIGQKICIKFYLPYNGKKQIEGVLNNISNKIISLQIENDIQNIELEKVASANIVFDDKGENDAK